MKLAGEVQALKAENQELSAQLVTNNRLAAQLQETQLALQQARGENDNLRETLSTMKSIPSAHSTSMTAFSPAGSKFGSGGGSPVAFGGQGWNVPEVGEDDQGNRRPTHRGKRR